ncbi:MAG: hypothetical protein F6K31_02740 [Symploca sp. SIO2G7]|nr:hypothetical protein [Symploca sp. SIO2G7]
MLKKGLTTFAIGITTLVAVSPAQAGTITYAPGPGAYQVDGFEPIGQSFVAEDALVEAGLSFSVINPSFDASEPIIYQLWEGFGVGGTLVADVAFTLDAAFSGFHLEDFSVTPLTVGSTYTLTASIDGTSPYWAISNTFDAPTDTGVCLGEQCDEVEFALNVKPLEVEDVPEPVSVLSFLVVSGAAACSSMKRKLSQSTSST